MPAPAYGQLVVSATRQQLSASAGQPAVFTIKAPISNANPVFLGDNQVTTANGFRLDPGESVDYQYQAENGKVRLELRPSDFWVIGTASDTITWLGSP